MRTEPIGCCFRLGGPRKLCWMIHTGCNLRCDHCAVFDNHFVASHSGVRSRTDIEQVLDFIRLREIEKVVISGGEPTLSRWCPDVIRRLAEERLDFSLSTNATTLTPSRLGRMLESGLTKATVSLDGATAATHDSVRGEGAFSKAMTGTAQLVEEGVAVSVGTFLREDTVEEIAALAHICRETGVRRLSLFHPVRRGRLSTGRSGPRAVSTPEVVRALRDQRRPGLEIMIHAPRCDEDDCPSGDEIFGAIGGSGFEHCVYKHDSTPRMSLDMLAA